MTPEEARQLLLREGEAIPVCVRMGDDPGKERLERVSRALDVIAEATRHEPSLDRALMYALLGHRLSWRDSGGKLATAQTLAGRRVQRADRRHRRQGGSLYRGRSRLRVLMKPLRTQ